jgi:hypothetical protein
VGTPQTATGGTYSFSSVALSAGDNTFSAGATDGLNPAVCSDPLSITRDSTAPSVAFDSASATTGASSYTLSGTASDGSTGSGIFRVTADTSGTSPGCSVTGTTSWSCTLAGIPSGIHTYTAIATDIAGNTTTSTSFSLTRSTSAPTLSLSSSTPTLPTAGGLTNAATLDLSLTAIPTGGATSISSVEVSTDGTTYSVPTTLSAGTWNTATLSLTNGSTYTLKARATDNLGNVSTVLDIDSFTVDSTAPTLSASTPIVLSGNGTCGTLCSVGNVITATVSFTESVTDTPGLTLQVGSSERTMTCSTDTGSTRTCTYTLTGSDDGSISILANKLTGTLSDLAGNTVASLNHSAVSSPSLTIDTTAPSITDVTVPADATYGSGQNLNFVATMSEATTTNGTPRIALTIGSTTQYATYLSGSGTTSLTFRYITQSGDNDTDGIAVTSPVQLNGGTLRDSASNDATLTFTPPTTTGVRVDTTAPTVAFTATAGSYASGQTLGLTATYSEPVTISAGGNPSVPLTLTTGTLTATDTGGAATNVTTRTFTTGTIGASGTHQDIDSTLNVGTVALNSATITDAAGNALTLTPTPATVTGVTINATGGTITTINVAGTNYRVHTFTSNGTFTVTGGGLVEYLVVGGGGAGGRGDDVDAGGGGGGGGRVVEGTITLPLGSISVTVGNGGTGGTSATDANSSGGNSQLGSVIIANGGGRGARVDPLGLSTGGSGGSGGGGFRNANLGGSAAAVTGGSYGYSGGKAGADSYYPYYVGGGGGGGAGGVGSNGSGINGGNGGAGRLSTIDGSSKYYGGGGGGGFSGTGSAGTGGNGVGGNGGSTGSTSGSAGLINRGGGGGGGSQGGSDCRTLGAGGCGGAGGSGIVIIRYPI